MPPVTSRELQGECVVTATGIEGSLVYALSPVLREAIERDGQATLHLDLAPGRDVRTPATGAFKPPRQAQPAANTCAGRRASMGVKAALLHEVLAPADAGRCRTRRGDPQAPAAGAACGRGPMAEAISSCRWCATGGARRSADARVAAGRVLRGRDAGLGGTHRRLPADRLLCQRAAGGTRCGGVVGGLMGVISPCVNASTATVACPRPRPAP